MCLWQSDKKICNRYVDILKKNVFGEIAAF